mmetsp:Transcript_158876/g.509459  ORF Transcript_158876/g.509459 Transcript_158876/m.509459 type:complete len:433 (+) Transcript_158876:385-1683(+)
MSRRELFAAEAVVAADDFLEEAALAQCRENVGMKRQGRGHILLRAVEHGDGLDARRHLGQEVLRRERPEQANLQDADLLALLAHIIHRFLRGFRCRAHEHDDSLCLGIAVVLEELVVPPCKHSHLVHGVLHDLRHDIVVLVRGHCGLVVGLRILAHAAHDWMLRVQAAPAESFEFIPRHERLHGAVRDRTHVLDDTRGTSAVKEMDEGHRGLDRREVGHEAQVHHLLRVVRREQGTTGGAHSHDIRVVAEDGQRLPCQSASRDVEHRRQELARTEVHVGDHEQKTLRGREGRAERASGQSAMQSTRGALLRLHLPHHNGLAEDILATSRGELVHRLAHARGGRDGVDERHVAQGIGYMCCRRVAIDGALGLALVVQGRHIDGATCSDLLGELAGFDARHDGSKVLGICGARGGLHGGERPCDSGGGLLGGHG